MPSANSIRLLAAAFAVAAFGLLSGCGGPPERPDTVLAADLVARGDANSAGAAQGRPVVVRLYELKSAGAFESADFFSLYQREAETLGADLLGREEVSLAPGQWHRVEKVISPETGYLGVLVAFRDIDRTRWRNLNRLRPNVTNRFTVTVGADQVSVAAN